MDKRVRETSLQAYEELDKLGERQRNVYEALKELGEATDYEIAKHLGKSDPNYVRPRRYELVEFKLVGFSQKRTCQITKKTCLAWKVVK